MIWPNLTRLHSAQAVDFGKTHPGVVGVVLEFRTIRDEVLAVALQPDDVEQLADMVDVLLDEIANHKAGLPITPELWELHPFVVDDPPAKPNDSEEREREREQRLG